MKAPEKLSELFNDKYFLAHLTQHFSDIKHKRKFRPQPKEGFHYKRDWFDRMSDNGQLNEVFLLKNITDILQKKSNLSSEVRTVLHTIFQTSLDATMNYYKTLN